MITTTKPVTLKQMRKALMGWTQQQLADELGVSRRTLIRYEQTGAPAPILKLATRILREQRTKVSA